MSLTIGIKFQESKKKSVNYVRQYYFITLS